MLLANNNLNTEINLITKLHFFNATLATIMSALDIVIPALQIRRRYHLCRWGYARHRGIYYRGAGCTVIYDASSCAVEPRIKVRQWALTLSH